MKQIAMKSIYTPLALLLLLALTGCSDFLGNIPKGYQIPTKVDEYEQLFNSDKLANLGTQDYDLMVDEIRILPVLDGAYYQLSLASMSAAWRNMYLFKDQFYTASEADVCYEDAYSRIFTYNSILDGLKTATGSEEDRARVRAEALAARALEYLTLVGIYGPTYSEAKASETPTVVLLLDNDINHKDLTPASQSDVYRQIISDLEEALPLLPDEPRYNAYRMSKPAAHGILAKAFFQMRDYKSALKYAHMVLSVKRDLVDYKTLSFNEDEWSVGGRNDYPEPLDNPENVLIRLLSPLKGLDEYALVSHDLPKLFDQERDQRFRTFFTTKPGGMAEYCPPGEMVWNPAIYPNVGISTPDMYLITAECEARIGDPNEALRLLNHLRDYRLLDNQPLQISDRKELIRTVLDERQREFLFRGFYRLVDLKRRAAEPEYAVTVMHHDADGKEVVSEPSSADYLKVPLPAKVLSFWGKSQE